MITLWRFFQYFFQNSLHNYEFQYFQHLRVKRYKIFNKKKPIKTNDFQHDNQNEINEKLKKLCLNFKIKNLYMIFFRSEGRFGGKETKIQNFV